MTQHLEISVFHGSTLMKIILREELNTNEVPTVVDEPEDSNVFYIYAKLFQKWSGYFQGITNFQEGAENTVTLRGISLRAFEQVLHWIYTGKLPSDAKYKSWEADLELYAAADFLIMPALADAVMVQVRGDQRGSEVTLSMLQQIQNAGIPETSRLASFAMDAIAYQAAAAGFADFKIEDGGREFFMEGGVMVVTLMEKIASALKKCDVYIKLGSWDTPDLLDPSSNNDHLYTEPTHGHRQD